MLATHFRTIAHLASDRDLKYLVRDYFSLPRGQALMPALLVRGLGQADLVLCLLRLRDTHIAMRSVLEDLIAMFVGHPILVGPACLQYYRTPAPTLRTTDDHRIAWVAAHNPRQPNTEAHQRWCEYRVGRTISQLVVRGVSRRDLRRALARGWVKMEEA